MSIVAIEEKSPIAWDLILDSKVMSVAACEARRIAAQYEDTATIEYEDALQEAIIILVTHPRMVSECLEDESLGYGVLATRLHQRLVKTVRTEAKKRSLVITIAPEPTTSLGGSW